MLWCQCVYNFSNSSLIPPGRRTALPKGMPKGIVGVEGEGGRLRRRAMFEDDDKIEVRRGSDDEEEEDADEEEDDDDDEDEEEGDDEGRGGDYQRKILFRDDVFAFSSQGLYLI